VKSDLGGSQLFHKKEKMMAIKKIRTNFPDFLNGGAVFPPAKGAKIYFYADLIGMVNEVLVAKKLTQAQLAEATVFMQIVITNLETLLSALQINTFFKILMHNGNKLAIKPEKMVC
jgi:hypothetical protein